jgi:uncharacterized protein (TIGR02145 family)
MKKLLLLLLIAPVLGFGQGEQRYADGTATDQDGNTFEWINYGTQDWAIENAEVVTYRDGTTITQVTYTSVWENLTTGAWCYYDNDPTKGKLYNWYAVKGIHDNDPNTPNKEFAPEGWHIPSYYEWDALRQYLRANGYSHNGNIHSNTIAKSMASITGWKEAFLEGVGAGQHLNNSSGFNAFPIGYRRGDFGDTVSFIWEGIGTFFLCSAGVNENDNDAWYFSLFYDNLYYNMTTRHKNQGSSIRFVRDASTASINYYPNAVTIYPNPTSSIVTLQGDKRCDIEVYTLQGKKIMALTGNTIDMSHLSSATYIVKALDKVENEEVSYKVVKN